MAEENDSQLEEEKAAKRSFKEVLSANKTLLQVTGLVLLLVVLMSVSVVAILITSGVVGDDKSNQKTISSISGAMLICDKELQYLHGDLMQAFALDDLSSHGDPSSGGYRLYYEVNMYRDSSRRSGVKKYFVNCYVSAKGNIKRFDFLEDRTFVPKAKRRTKGNAIGL